LDSTSLFNGVPEIFSSGAFLRVALEDIPYQVLPYYCSLVERWQQKQKYWCENAVMFNLLGLPLSFNFYYLELSVVSLRTAFVLCCSPLRMNPKLKPSRRMTVRVWMRRRMCRQR
jgi:hypothetical protein